MAPDAGGAGAWHHQTLPDHPAARDPQGWPGVARAWCGLRPYCRPSQHAPTPGRRRRRGRGARRGATHPAATWLPGTGTRRRPPPAALEPARARSHPQPPRSRGWRPLHRPCTPADAQPAPASMHGTFGRHGCQPDRHRGACLTRRLGRADVAAMPQTNQRVGTGARMPGLLFLRTTPEHNAACSSPTWYSTT